MADENKPPKDDSKNENQGGTNAGDKEAGRNDADKHYGDKGNR